MQASILMFFLTCTSRQHQTTAFYDFRRLIRMSRRSFEIIGTRTVCAAFFHSSSFFELSRIKYIIKRSALKRITKIPCGHSTKSVHTNNFHTHTTPTGRHQAHIHPRPDTPKPVPVIDPRRMSVFTCVYT